MLELMNKIFFRLDLFLTGRKCPNCDVRKLLGSPLIRFEDGELGFARTCFNCFAHYKSVGGKVTFLEFLNKEEFE